MTAYRPRQHLAALAKSHPDAWRDADDFRAAPPMPWPDWCFLPIAGWQAIVGQGRPLTSLPQIIRAAELAALGAWRVTQGIYRFDPTLYAALLDTPLDGELPHALLQRLPAWGVYIETPGLTLDGAVCHGCYAHLEHDLHSQRAELRLLFDAASLLPLPLHLGPWSLADSLARMEDIAMAGIVTSASMREAARVVLSLLLYLCSDGADLAAGHARARPQPKATKRGPRLFAPDQPATWDVGVRIGAALRRAYHDAEHGQGDGSHAGPRPHIRRAHWHGFRSGPKKRDDGSDIPTAARRYDLRWLPPIPVGMELGEDMPAVIHRVEG